MLDTKSYSCGDPKIMEDYQFKLGAVPEFLKEHIAMSEIIDVCLVTIQMHAVLFILPARECRLIM